MWQELKEFAVKGSVVDLIIGILIGASFSKIVKMSAATLAAAREQGAVLAYGSFVAVLIGFLVIAFILFQLVKLSNRMRRRSPRANPTASEKLLEEIRNALQHGSGKD